MRLQSAWTEGAGACDREGSLNLSTSNSTYGPPGFLQPPSAQESAEEVGSPCRGLGMAGVCYEPGSETVNHPTRYFTTSPICAGCIGVTVTTYTHGGSLPPIHCAHMVTPSVQVCCSICHLLTNQPPNLRGLKPQL